jgi:hypothetical protein
MRSALAGRVDRSSAASRGIRPRRAAAASECNRPSFTRGRRRTARWRHGPGPRQRISALPRDDRDASFNRVLAVEQIEAGAMVGDQASLTAGTANEAGAPDENRLVLRSRQASPQLAITSTKAAP